MTAVSNPLQGGLTFISFPPPHSDVPAPCVAHCITVGPSGGGGECYGASFAVLLCVCVCWGRGVSQGCDGAAFLVPAVDIHAVLEETGAGCGVAHASTPQQRILHLHSLI